MPPFKKVLFLPKLQSHFAEFLQYSYLIHLSLLDLSTCVGLGYGLFIKKAVSWRIKILVTFFKKFNLKIIPSKFAFVKSFLGAVSLYEIHLYIETLGFTVIMILIHYFLLLMPAFSFLISSIYFTTYLYQHTECSATVYNFYKLDASVNFFSPNTFSAQKN